MGFCSLQHIRDRRSTCRGLCLGPLRSALRVWLPSRRLTPSEPVPGLFRPGGAHGIRPSEPSPLKRYPPLSRANGPTYRLTRRCFRRRGRWTGPTSAGFWALTLSRVPGGLAGFNSPTTGCSLGFCPSRAKPAKAWPGTSPGLLPRAFRPPISRPAPRGASEFQSTLASPQPLQTASRLKWVGQPL
jgi:hypothetical protein